MPKNIPDQYVRRQFYLIGLGNRLGDIFAAELNKSNRDSRAILYDMLPEIFDKRPLSKIRARKLEQLADDIAEVRGERLTRFRDQFEAELEKMVAGEFKKNDEIYSSAPVDYEDKEDPVAFWPLILSGAIIDGQTIDEWFDGFKTADKARIQQSISSGVVNGMSEKQIATQLLGTKSQNYRDGDLNISQNSARTLARTITSGTAVLARSEWADSVKKKSQRKTGLSTGLIVGGMDLVEVFSAVLDSYTTWLCASLSGNTYEIGVGPYPPLHYNCRSSRYPIPRVMSAPETLSVVGISFIDNAKRTVGNDEWFDKSKAEKETAVLDQKKAWLKKNFGELPENMEFEQWFSKQPSTFQRDYLGKSRYDAWTNGDLEIGDFVAPSGQRYTIEQLEKKGVL